MTAPGPAVDALTARFVAALGRRGAMAELMAVASLGGTPLRAETPPDVPVLAHLDDAVARVAEEVDPQLAQAVGLLASRAAWTRTESYVDDTALFAGYAHAELRTDGDLTLGLVVLGPHVLYRAHHHPAEEYYLPLGAVRFDHGEGWVDEPAGELVHHAEWQPHAMETGDRAVLLAYLWLGDVDVPSVFVDA